MIAFPSIPVDSISYLRPELVGLSAWLGASPLYQSDRAKILAHVGQHGSFEGLFVAELLGDRLESAKRAHRDWLDYLAATDTTPARTLIAPVNGRRFALPPFTGGSPEAAGVAASVEPRDGHPAEEIDDEPPF